MVLVYIIPFFMAVRKVQPSLHQFSHNSQMLHSITCISLIPDFTPDRQ